MKYANVYLFSLSRIEGLVMTHVSIERFEFDIGWKIKSKNQSVENTLWII